MSRLLLSALAVLAFAGPAIALAQQAGEIQVKILKQDASPAARYVLAPQEFRNYAQQYQLETGMVLAFEEHHHRYFTRLRNEPKVEIFPLAEGVFRSANGTLFVFRDDGDSIEINHMERLPFAGLAAMPTTRVLASLR